jgi:hypothetical protein
VRINIDTDDFLRRCNNVTLTQAQAVNPMSHKQGTYHIQGR